MACLAPGLLGGSEWCGFAASFFNNVRTEFVHASMNHSAHVRVETKTLKNYALVDAAEAARFNTPGTNLYTTSEGDGDASDMSYGIKIYTDSFGWEPWQGSYSADVPEELAFPSIIIDALLGVALDGVPIYSALSAAEGTDGVEYTYDVFNPPANTGISPLAFDSCGGTFGLTPDGFKYHYRTIPSCILEGSDSKERRFNMVVDVGQLADSYNNYLGQHLIGFSIQGFPIYSPLNTRGLEHKDLDSCGGKWVNGSYGYYARTSFPYTIGCFGPAPDSISKEEGKTISDFVSGDSHTVPYRYSTMACQFRLITMAIMRIE
jgi:hypothetical protein